MSITTTHRPATVNAHDSHRMHCMEVWGSNRAVDSGVIMAGLDAWVYSKPWQDGSSGGDVHYVSSCATGRITRLLLADVSGHGESVSETAAMLRRVMRRYVNHIEQRQFVRMMNRAMVRQDDQRFATSVVASFFAPRSQLIVSNAGHPPPLLWRKRTGQWSYIDQTEREAGDKSALSNMPLGILRETDYDEQRLQLDVGDIVLLHSDALVEARSADGDQLGLDGLLNLVSELDVSQPGTLVEQLRSRLESLNPSNLSGDDLTVMIFRPNGVGDTSNFFTRAWAGVRIIGTAVGQFFGSGRPVPWPEMTFEAMFGTPAARLFGRVRDSNHR